MKKRYVIPVFSHRNLHGLINKSVYFMHEPHHTYTVARDNDIDMCGGDPHSLFTKPQINQMIRYYHNHQDKNQYYTNLLRSVFVINSLYDINPRLADYCWDIISDNGKKIISKHQLIDIIKNSGLVRYITIPSLVKHNMISVSRHDTKIHLADKHAKAIAKIMLSIRVNDLDGLYREESTYDRDALATKHVFVRTLYDALSKLKSNA